MLRTVSERCNLTLISYCMVILHFPMTENILIILAVQTFKLGSKRFEVLCYNIQMIINTAFNQIYQMTHSVSPCETCTVILINLIYPSNPL